MTKPNQINIQAAQFGAATMSPATRASHLLKAGIFPAFCFQLSHCDMMCADVRRPLVRPPGFRRD